MVSVRISLSFASTFLCLFGVGLYWCYHAVSSHLPLNKYTFHPFEWDFRWEISFPWLHKFIYYYNWVHGFLTFGPTKRNKDGWSHFEEGPITSGQCQEEVPCFYGLAIFFFFLCPESNNPSHASWVLSLFAFEIWTDESTLERKEGSSISLAFFSLSAHLPGFDATSHRCGWAHPFTSQGLNSCLSLPVTKIFWCTTLRVFLGLCFSPMCQEPNQEIVSYKIQHMQSISVRPTPDNKYRPFHTLIFLWTGTRTNFIVIKHFSSIGITIKKIYS